MFPLTDRAFSDAQKYLFVNDFNESFLEKVHVMVEPTFCTLMRTQRKL